MEVSSQYEVRALLSSHRMRRGFTLLEVMVVVAIIGVVMALVGTATQRSQRRARSHDAARQFRTRLEHARTLAQAAGPLLGTPMFHNCANPAANTLDVDIDPGANAYTVPVSLRFLGTGQLESSCQVYQVSAGTESRDTATITVNGGAAPTTLTFSPNGRLVAPAAAFVRFEDSFGTEATRGFGFRVLGSGVICSASDPVNATCDEDI